MRTKSKDGIICDKCGLTSSVNFTYYSVDLYKVPSNSKVRSISNCSLSLESSIDYCGLCFTELSRIIVANYSKLSSSINSTKVIICEYTGSIIKTDYYYVVVDKVQVDTQKNIVDIQRKMVEFAINNETCQAFLAAKQKISNNDWQTS